MTATCRSARRRAECPITLSRVRLKGSSGIDWTPRSCRNAPVHRTTSRNGRYPCRAHRQAGRENHPSWRYRLPLDEPAPPTQKAPPKQSLIFTQIAMFHFCTLIYATRSTPFGLRLPVAKPKCTARLLAIRRTSALPLPTNLALGLWMPVMKRT